MCYHVVICDVMLCMYVMLCDVICMISDTVATKTVSCVSYQYPVSNAVMLLITTAGLSCSWCFLCVLHAMHELRCAWIQFDMMCYDVMWCDAMWCDAMRCYAILCYAMWMLCDVMWCDVILLCDVMSCDTFTNKMVSCVSIPGSQCSDAAYHYCRS